jgi:hypothetical protein
VRQNRKKVVQSCRQDQYAGIELRGCQCQLRETVKTRKKGEKAGSLVSGTNSLHNLRSLLMVELSKSRRFHWFDEDEILT